ncbi:hypothetical protein [Natranaerobius trueperi]|uniref:hypothetical protein n=1 Tax=Natranaerobius trueperi TaxID=759412 RepID=UPI001303B547|nr:hypothetical protein [Natranaerobius trueperi]
MKRNNIDTTKLVPIATAKIDKIVKARATATLCCLPFDSSFGLWYNLWKSFI